MKFMISLPLLAYSNKFARRTAVSAWLAIVLACAATPVAAQKASAESAAQLGELTTQLLAEKKTAAIIENSPNYAADAPPSATDEELKLRRYYASERVRAIEASIRNVKHLNELHHELESAKQQANAWTTLDAEPPYSVTFVDQLLREQVSAESNLQALNSRAGLFLAIRDTISATIKGLSATVRQKEEAVSRATATQRPSLAWSLELDRQRLRTSSATLKSISIAQEENQIEIQIAEAALSLAQRKSAAVQGKTTFTAQAYEQLQASLDAESKAISGELSKAIEGELAATRQLSQASEALARNQAEASASGVNTTDSATTLALQQAVTLAQLDLDASNAQMDLLRMRPSVLELTRAVWDYRYRNIQNPTPKFAAEVKRNLAELTEKLNLMSRLVERQKAVLRSDMSDKEQQSITTTDAGDKELLRRALANDEESERILRQLNASISTAQSLILRVEDESGSKDDDHRWGSRVSSAYYFSLGMLQSAWNFELIAIEDTIEVDGSKITGYTSITVGKVLRAIFMFVVGVFLSIWLSKQVEIYVVRRFHYDPTQARILRKWLSGAGFGILLVVILIWVRIPLSVFAFMGGAVAIGIGFGMQNMLKNLISGLMLLFERPFRPGDLIEVDQIRGNIVEIGIRSSVVRDINGVDTLIPNNTFVEQNVTNWTYNSAKVRFCIKVGIAYGSPVRDAANHLQDCAARHGLVLKDPPPEVLFENFGADSLEFGLYYWLEIGPTVANRIVSSDLRFMIDKSFAEHGISISYPQRDVHLDMNSPIRVHIQNPE